MNKEQIKKIFKKGQAYFDEEEYEKAIKCYDQIIEEDPDYVLALLNKCASLYNLNKKNSAKIFFDKYLSSYDDIKQVCQLRDKLFNQTHKNHVDELVDPKDQENKSEKKQIEVPSEPKSIFWRFVSAITCGVSLFTFSLLNIKNLSDELLLFWSLASFVVGIAIGLIPFVSSIFIKFGEWGKRERTKNYAERDRLRTIEREEYAREKGRVNANGGYSNQESSVHIHLDSRRRRHSEDGIKGPMELREGYKASKRRAEEEYRRKDSGMRDKIW